MGAARAIGIETLVFQVRTPKGYDHAFRTLDNEVRAGMILLGSPKPDPFPDLLCGCDTQPDLADWGGRQNLSP
jgi:hypothetical protein